MFSWPYGFPSHASPFTPGVITEGGELGYALGAAYGAVLGRPEKTVFCLIGDGELETATAIDSFNLPKLLNNDKNGRVIPVIHLNEYKISGPTIYGRKSERELMELFRGFSLQPVLLEGVDSRKFQEVLRNLPENAVLLVRTEKGYGGPQWLDDEKIANNCKSHQVPLPLAGSDMKQLQMLRSWLESYNFKELYEEFKR